MDADLGVYFKYGGYENNVESSFSPSNPSFTFLPDQCVKDSSYHTFLRRGGGGGGGGGSPVLMN